MKAENWICCVSCSLRIVLVSKEELASLCSPIPGLGFLGKKQERSRVFLVLFSTRFVSKLPIGYKTKQENFSVLLFLAEREGFEPPVPLSTPVFKTGAIDHSATSPKVFCVSRCGRFVLTLQKYIKDLNCARVCKKNFKYFFKFVLFWLFSCLFTMFSTDFGL